MVPTPFFHSLMQILDIGFVLLFLALRDCNLIKKEIFLGTKQVLI